MNEDPHLKDKTEAWKKWHKPHGEGGTAFVVKASLMSELEKEAFFAGWEAGQEWEWESATSGPCDCEDYR